MQVIPRLPPGSMRHELQIIQIIYTRSGIDLPCLADLAHGAGIDDLDHDVPFPTDGDPQPLQALQTEELPNRWMFGSDVYCMLLFASPIDCASGLAYNG